MIRTRDFVLYIVVFLFVFIGLTYTVATHNRATAERDQTELFQGASVSISEATTGETLDRQENLRRLREQIARGEGQITQGPPVFDSVDTVTIHDVTTTEATAGSNEDTIEETSREPKVCIPTTDYSAVTARWPSVGAVFNISEGARLVSIEELEEITVGSSTEATTTTSLVLQLPAAPQRSLASNCLDNETIGLTTDGQLIKNTDTWRFRSLPDNTLIGYARDGHPIFSQTSDETVLDSCGGYDTGAGYQYHIRADELFVLACFAATPRPFLN